MPGPVVALLEQTVAQGAATFAPPQPTAPQSTQIPPGLISARQGGDDYIHQPGRTWRIQFAQTSAENADAAGLRGSKGHSRSGTDCSVLLHTFWDAKRAFQGLSSWKSGGRRSWRGRLRPPGWVQSWLTRSAVESVSALRRVRWRGVMRGLFMRFNIACREARLRWG